jgi:MFS family permease
MHLGRFIFGLGGESIHVTQKALVSKWFNPNELNLVFGLLSSAALLGSSFSQLIIEPIYHYVSQSQDDYKGYQLLGIAISIGSLICVLSLFSSFILFRLDKKRDNWILSKNNRDQEENHGIQLKDVLRFPVKLWFLVLVCGVL